MKRLLMLVLCLCLTTSLVSCDAIQSIADLFLENIDVQGAWEMEVVNLSAQEAKTMFREMVSKAKDEEIDVDELMNALGNDFDYADYIKKACGSMYLIFKDNGNYTMGVHTEEYLDAMWSVTEKTIDRMKSMVPAEYVAQYIAATGDDSLTVALLKEALEQMGTTWEAYRDEMIQQTKDEAKEGITPESAAKAVGGKLNSKGEIVVQSGSYSVHGNQVTMITVDANGDTAGDVMTLDEGEGYFALRSMEGENGAEISDDFAFYQKFASHMHLVKATDKAA